MAVMVRVHEGLARRLIKIAAVLITLGALAQDAAPGDEGMHRLLPRRIAGWSAVGEDQAYTRATLFDYMDGAGEIYLAYDFQRLLVREYSKGSAPRIVAEIYQMSSSEDAYGIFSHDTDGTAVALGQGAIYSAGLLRFWKDRLFVRLLAERETAASKAAAWALGETIAKAISRAGKKPRLLACLPPRGLLRPSIRYFHTPVSLNVHYYLADANLLNLSPTTDALLARYQRNGRKVRSLLCRYADPRQAKAAFEQFTRIYFSDKPTRKSASRVEKVEKGEFVSAHWTEAFLILVFEAWDRRTCEVLTAAVVEKVKEVYP